MSFVFCTAAYGSQSVHVMRHQHRIRQTPRANGKKTTQSPIANSIEVQQLKPEDVASGTCAVL